MASLRKEFEIPARQGARVAKQVLSSREDKQEKPLHGQSGGLSSHDKEEKPNHLWRLSIYLFTVSVGNCWYGETQSGKRLG